MNFYIVLFFAILLGGGGVAWAVITLMREKSRNEQELEAEFRKLLLAKLRKHGPARLEFRQLVAESETPAKIATRTARQLYTNLCEKVVEDGVITEDERRSLDALRKGLELSPEDAQEMESYAVAERYRSAAMNALADGVITAEEEEELKRLRSSLGLNATEANQIVGPKAIKGYVELFRQVIEDGRITAEELKELRRYRSAMSLSREEANESIRRDVIGLYRQWFYNIIQDGEVTPEEEEGLIWLRNEFGLDEQDTKRFDEQLSDVKRLAAYRKGQLPKVRTSKLLEGGEICHWEGRANFEWRTATMTKDADGEMIVTSQRIIFTSPVRSFEFSPAKIIDIERSSGSLSIRCSSKSGGGTYYLRDCSDLEAILTGLAKTHKFQTSAGFSSDLTRHIPDTVRREVWHRDGGKCVRCDAMDYLEYDHVIPHSKGGANTVSNVQILCRRCNNQKSDRI